MRRTNSRTTDRPVASITLAVVAALVAAGAMLAAPDAAQAQSTRIIHAPSVPYEPRRNLNTFTTLGRTSIEVPARLHREVEVSRSLAAQPVYPHMVKVIMGGSGKFAADDGHAVIHTWIDPLRRLDGENGLDENHSLVKAQRLFLSLSGTSQRQTDEARVHSHRLQRGYADQTRAHIVTPGTHHGRDAQDAKIVYPLQRANDPAPGGYYIPPEPRLREVDDEAQLIAGPADDER